jgi:hypothetical protein
MERHGKTEGSIPVQQLQTAFGSPGKYALETSPAMEGGIITPPALIRTGPQIWVTSIWRWLASADGCCVKEYVESRSGFDAKGA